KSCGRSARLREGNAASRSEQARRRRIHRTRSVFNGGRYGLLQVHRALLESARLGSRYATTQRCRRQTLHDRTRRSRQTRRHRLTRIKMEPHGDKESKSQAPLRATQGGGGVCVGKKKRLTVSPRIPRPKPAG